MTSLTVILTTLSCLLLGAHALRTGDWGLTLAWVGMAGLVVLRRAWVRIVLLAALLFGVLTWVQVSTGLIQVRMAFGVDWGRLALIMSGVVLITLLAAGLLAGEPGRRFFPKGEDQAGPVAAIFLLTVAGLGFLHTRVELSLLLAARYFPGWGWLQIFALGLYGAWIGNKMLDAQKAPRVRSRIWALFSLVFFAQLGLGLLGKERMLMTGDLHLPVPALIMAGPIFRGHGFFMLILFLSTVALVGPAWCSHLCYIGAWDDRAGRLKHKRPLGGLPRWAWQVRWAIFLLVPLAALAFRTAGMPGLTAVWIAAVFGLVGVGIMVWLSRRRGMMVHCSAYCPIGLLGNLLGRLTPWRLRIASGCTGCMACTRVCRYNALNRNHLERGRPGLSCTLCGDCVGICPGREISYGFLHLSPRSSRRLFVVLVVSLHAVFLAVARI